MRHGLLAFGFRHHFGFVARVGRQRPAHFVGSLGCCCCGGGRNFLFSSFPPVALAVSSRTFTTLALELLKKSNWMMIKSVLSCPSAAESARKTFHSASYPGLFNPTLSHIRNVCPATDPHQKKNRANMKNCLFRSASLSALGTQTHPRTRLDDECASGGSKCRNGIGGQPSRCLQQSRLQ